MRLSDEMTDLGQDYGIDAWVLNKRNKTHSDLVISAINPVEARKIRDYLGKIGCKRRVRYDGQNMVIQMSSITIETTSAFFDLSFSEHNRNFLNGNRTTPIKLTGSTTLDLDNGGIYEPDASYQVRNRAHQSPNAILEVHHYSSSTIINFCDELRNVIQSVMTAAGVQVYDRFSNGSFAAVFVVWERDLVIANQANLIHLISFGTANLHQTAQADWNVATGGSMIGAIEGADGVACVAPVHPLFLPSNLPRQRWCYLGSNSGAWCSCSW